MTKKKTAAIPTDLEEFKKHVVTVAKKFANEYDWCEVVDDALRMMGLEEYLPPTYSVEQRLSGRHKWQKYRGPYDSFDAALEDARDCRYAVISRHNKPLRKQSVYIGEAVPTYLDRGVDIDKLIKEFTDAVKAAEKRLPPAEPPTVVPKYPMYRVVSSDGVVAQEITDADFEEEEE